MRRSGRARRGGTLFRALVCASVLGGCHLVLGIEDATVRDGSGGAGAGGQPQGTQTGGGGSPGVGGAGGAGNQGGEGGAGGLGGAGGSGTTSGGSVCGNGVPEPGEECDDGNTDDNDACRNLCVAAFCGDGVLWVGVEECDDANGVDEDSCINGCIAAKCGDGIVRAGVEACDDGNNIDNDGCRNDCSLPTCGDGVVQAGEDCDDQNLSNTDGCLNTCKAASCGDGFVRAGVEACDDGNQSNNDDCLDTCELAYCGDGFVKASSQEYCDDGNTVTGDGCHLCQVIVQVAAKNHHACARSSSGDVKCWGRNDWGQLGQGHANVIGDDPGEIAALPAIALGQPATDVAVGDRHTCAALLDGTVKCWGWNGYGQLGIGLPIGQSIGVAPADMGNLAAVSFPFPVQKLSLGYYRSCALLSNGEVYCWGRNGQGALGSGTAEMADPYAATPRKVEVGGVAVDVTTFTRHTCILTAGGDVRCWGENAYGALGIGMATGFNVGDEPNDLRDLQWCALLLGLRQQRTARLAEHRGPR